MLQIFQDYKFKIQRCANHVPVHEGSFQVVEDLSRVKLRLYREHGHERDVKKITIFGIAIDKLAYYFEQPVTENAEMRFDRID